MQCPFCGESETRVIDSRLVVETNQVRRRRECCLCLERFTSYEKIELTLPRLIKKNGTFVQFDEQKLRAGILRSLEKRPVPCEEVEKTVSHIIHRLRTSGERAITTNTLGKWVMADLKILDEVAYLRFASVYRAFQSIDEFYEAVTVLQQETTNEK